MLSDLRFTFRALASAPGFASVVVLILALGVGTGTAVFSVAHAVLLRPLPFLEPEKVLVLSEVSASSDSRYVAPITFDDWRTRHRSFEEIAAFRHWENVNLEDATADPEPITLTTGTANLFRALGVAPLLGRTYREEQSRHGGSEAVIGYELWRRRYHGDPAVLGRIIRIRGTATTIVGVMPRLPAATSTGWGDVWTCLYRYNLAQMRATGYRARYLTVVGRLAAGVSMEQAAARMDALQRQLWKEPLSVAEGYDVRLQPLTDVLLGDVRLPMLVVAGAVATLIIVACANVATLMLARGSSRRRETAVRLALGAGAFTVVRLAAVEGLVLALAGSAAGLAVAWASLRALASVGSVLPRFNEAGLSLEAVWFALALSVGSTLACSAVSFGELKRPNLSDVLSESGRAGTPGARGHRLRRGLVALQIAMACALLITGSLLLRSFANILREHPGFEATRAVYFDLYLPNSRYPDEPAHTRFYRELMRKLEDAPSIEAAGGLLYFPYKPKQWPASIEVDGRPVPEGQEPIVFYNQVAGDYFRAMGIPLQAGRLPTEQETWEPDAPRVVVINQTMATLLFGDATAIGRRIRSGGDEAWSEIVGVVSDVRQQRLDLPASAEYYTTFKQMPMPFQSVVVRGRSDRPVPVSEARDVVRRLDPGLALANLMPLQEWVWLHTGERQFALWVLSAIAMLAFLIGIVGVYGAVSYAVAQRRREMGIRLALGASPGDVRALVFGEGLRLVLAGTGVGVLAAVLAAPVTRGMLYGLGPLDPVAYVAVASLLALAALAACWRPARSASRLPLAQTLRAD